MDNLNNNATEQPYVFVPQAPYEFERHLEDMLPTMATMATAATKQYTRKAVHVEKHEPVVVFPSMVDEN